MPGVGGAETGVLLCVYGAPAGYGVGTVGGDMAALVGSAYALLADGVGRCCQCTGYAMQAACRIWHGTRLECGVVEGVERIRMA
jgi:hypothetical protein